jgi:hypothetical protein
MKVIAFINQLQLSSLRYHSPHQSSTEVVAFTLVMRLLASPSPKGKNQKSPHTSTLLSPRRQNASSTISLTPRIFYSSHYLWPFSTLFNGKGWEYGYILMLSTKKLNCEGRLSLISLLGRLNI